MKQTSVNGGMTDTDVHNKTHFGSMAVRLHKTKFNQKYVHTILGRALITRTANIYRMVIGNFICNPLST